MGTNYTRNKKSILQKVRFLTGYRLKMLGLVCMVFDHIYQMFSVFNAPIWLTMVGRVVLPIFLFTAAEGFSHTRSKKKYMFRLLIAFWVMMLLSQIISRLFPLDDVNLINNVFGTMFVSTFYMWMIDIFSSGVKQKKVGKIVISIGGMLLPLVSAFAILGMLLLKPNTFTAIISLVVPTALTVEGGVAAVVLAAGFYIARQHRMIQIILLVAISLLSAVMGDGIQWLMVFAAIPIWLYNGEAGRKSKYFFYVFYPAHIYILYILSYILH